MNDALLVIGSPRYSSWSLRPWLLMRQLGIPFRHETIELYRPDTRARILAHSPAAKVPVLKADGLVVWESLAIVERLAERHPEHGVWPADQAARALARSLAAEMHAGFGALRQEFPMDLVGAERGRTPTPEAVADIARVAAAWSEARRRFGAGGPFLFGAFSAADAMFAPVAVRLVTYGLPLDDAARAYAEAVWTLPAMDEWRRLAGIS